MPKFSANLSFLFPEVSSPSSASRPPRRPASAAVEFAFAYEHPAEQVAAAAKSAGVEVVLMNLPPGDWNAGERGLGRAGRTHGRFPRRPRHRHPLRRGQWLPPAPCHGRRRSHCKGGCLRRKFGLGCGSTDKSRHRASHRAHQCHRHARLFSDPGSGAADHRASRPPKSPFAARPLSCQIMRGDLARQIEAHLPLVRHIQIAGNPGVTNRTAER